MAIGIERAILLETDGGDWDPVATAGAIAEAIRGPGGGGRAVRPDPLRQRGRPTPATSRSGSGSPWRSAGRSSRASRRSCRGDGRVVARREAPGGGWETYELPLPAVVGGEGGPQPAALPVRAGPAAGEEEGDRAARRPALAGRRRSRRSCFACRRRRSTAAEVIGRGPDAAPAVVDLLDQHRGARPMTAPVLVLVDHRRRRAGPASLEALTVARGLAAGDRRAARGGPRRGPAPTPRGRRRPGGPRRRRRASSSSTTALTLDHPAAGRRGGRGSSPRRGPRVGRRRRAPSAATRCSPVSPPGSGLPMAANVSTVEAGRAATASSASAGPAACSRTAGSTPRSGCSRSRRTPSPSPSRRRHAPAPAVERSRSSSSRRRTSLVHVDEPRGAGARPDLARGRARSSSAAAAASGSAEGFARARGAGRPARRGGRRVAGRDERGLAAARRPDRPDRPADRARHLHRLRDQRRDPAHRRLQGGEADPRDQHRRRGADHGRRRLRRDRRPPHGRAGDHRRDPAAHRPAAADRRPIAMAVLEAVRARGP